MRTWSFAKGHGTLNDFVLVKDRSGMLHFTAEDVRFLCDRRAGIGADGFIRAVKAVNVPEWTGPGDLWFMDYRNADGSLAAMCGNGLRVFVRWLLDEDLVAGDVIQIATRAGIREARVCRDGRISAAMGIPVRDDRDTTARQSDRIWTGRRVDVGNEHCVIRLSGPEELAALDLSHDIGLDPDVFPDGANVEFVVASDDRHLTMRVRERGAGETMSCGTGVVAVCCDRRDDTGIPGPYRVQVPGGLLRVDFTDQGEAWLTGPAVIVAHGEVIVPDE